MRGLHVLAVDDPTRDRDRSNSVPSIFARLRLRKGVATGAAIAVLAGVPFGIALTHQGFPVTAPDLHARDVWVTNGEKLLAGRLNRQIEELDAAVATTSNDTDVFQNGDDAFVYDPGAGSVQRIDPAFTTLVQRIDVPPASQVAYGGGVLAVLSPKGELWRVSAGGQLAFDWRGTKPVAKLGSDGHVAVSQQGTVFGSSPAKHSIVSLPKGATDLAWKDVGSFGAHQLAAVGERPVLFDSEHGRVIADGTRVDLHGTAARLQQSGPEADAVYLADGAGLIAVPFDGGSVRRIPDGAPAVDPNPARIAAPVRLGDCVHGAWADAGRYLLACDGKAPKGVDIAQPTTGARLEFRVNRDVIVLNNLQNGNSWLLDKDLKLVDNWDEVTPPKESDKENGKEKVAKQTFEDTIAHRTPQNHPPVARDDDFGVRPGRATILDVLANDTDPDGDVLTISKTTDVPAAAGKLDVIDGGRALQFTPAPNAAGTVSFRYTADDGRGGVAEASVNVRIVPLAENTPPTQLRKTQVSVEQGQKVTYNVLSDWKDPDGDDLYLASASPTSGDIVRSSPDGFVTFEHASSELGQKEVQYTVSDGKAAVNGTLVVDVKPAGTLDPIGTPDYAQAFVGQSFQISPLENDVSPSGAPLKLLGVEEVPGWASVTPNLERGTLSFSATQPGDAEFIYDLGAGQRTSKGLIRVHVVAPTDQTPPPIAVRDTAYLRAGEPVTVPVLANDVSPSGRVLAVQSVDDSQVKGLVNVQLLTNTAIRVSASQALDKQAQFSYTISDGAQTSTSTVTVVPVPPLVKHQPPVAVDDTAIVRAGDIVTVPVLANDFHPDGAKLHVVPDQLDTTGLQGQGLAFVADDKVRYEAPDTPGVYSVVYTIGDDFGQIARAKVTFTVTAKDASKNRPPLPDPLTSRVFAGSTVKIDVPLDGLDPDGDSVNLVGMASSPNLGRIVSRTSRSITYEAFPGSTGTDSFSYTVGDTFGATAIGTIRIGVIPPPPVHLPPKAVDDYIEMKPGRTASAEVLLNDSDPNGFPLQVSRLPEVQPGITAEIQDNRRVVVKAPDKEGAYTIRYEISNGHGGVDSAFLQVAVKRDAKIQPPTAQDQVIEPEQVTSNKPVNVQPLKDATNPGGLVSDLVVTLEGPNADRAKVRSDGSIDVTPGTQRYAVAYRVTDKPDDLSAMAFVIVPPVPGGDKIPQQTQRPKTPEEIAAEERAKFPAPHLKDLAPIVVPMNGQISWSVDQLVVVPSGKPALILSANASSAREPAFVDGTHLQYKPAKDYRGPASLTFEVTDGSGPDDPIGRKAILTLPITVGDPNYNDTPPTFTPRTETIQAGEAPLDVDLRQSTDQPNPANIDKISYTNLKSSNPAIQGDIPDGHTLRLSAPFGVQPGTAARFTFDLKFNEFTVPGYVDVKVVSSTRALPKANDDAVEMQRSQTQTVDVLANDFNPFAQDGKPLTVVKAIIDQQSVGSAASVSFTPQNVTVTTGPSFTGTLSVVYTIQDATQDPARESSARLNVTVRAAPDAPKAPSANAAGSNTATVTWQVPADNNSPISGYDLYWTGGGHQHYDASAGGVQQTIGGLTNGTAYTFWVTATNAIGTSGNSPQSGSVTPYGTPGTPGVSVSNSGYAPATVYVNWSTPSSGGGSLRYTVCLDGGNCRGVNGNSTSYGGVGAGNHTATVYATNTGNVRGPDGSGSTYISNPPPPQPQVVATKGASVGYYNGPYGYCNSNCNEFNVDIYNFTPYTQATGYAVCNGYQLSTTIRINVDGNGYGNYRGVFPQAWCGDPTAYVVINGIQSNNWY